MSALSFGEFSPKMMILGLLAQEPDSVAGVARRLTDQFPSAGVAKNSAHNNLPKLAEDGYLQLVQAGGKSSRDRYETTAEGLALLRGWLRRSELPPVVRDSIQCKLELIDLDDLAPVVRTILGQEDAYRRASGDAQWRLVAEQSSRRARGVPVHWRVKLQAILRKREVTLWDFMAGEREGLREELEELLDEVAAGGLSS
jgi:DNA-binding PadR family transcriptional regulator